MPAVATLSLQGAVGQSANLVEVKNSTGTVLVNVNLSGVLTAPSFVPSSSTVPTNGVYLPAANTLGFATNSTERVRVDAAGGVGIGTTASAGRTVQISRTMTGSTNAQGIRNSGTIQSDVTSSAFLYSSLSSTAAASFTLGVLSHFNAEQGSIGAGSTITTQYGFYANGGLTGAISNYGFVSAINSAANRWNFYADGTAANYFAGQTVIGSTSLTLGGSSAAQQFGVVSGAATTVGAVIRGAASQTANLQEWQDSAGTILQRITSGGTMRAEGAPDQFAIVSSNSNGTSFRFESTATNGRVWRVGHNFVVGGGEFSIYDNTAARETLRISNAGNVLISGFTSSTAGLTVKGAVSQTADLQRWENSSGGALVTLANDGNFSAPYARITTPSASVQPLIVKGAASQTANLQEWQNSGGTVIASVESTGIVRGLSVATNTSFATLADENSGGRIRLTKMSSSATAPGADLAKIYLVTGTLPNTLKLVIRAGASGAETTILDNIPT